MKRIVIAAVLCCAASAALAQSLQGGDARSAAVQSFNGLPFQISAGNLLPLANSIQALVNEDTLLRQRNAALEKWIHDYFAMPPKAAKQP